MHHFNISHTFIGLGIIAASIAAVLFLFFTRPAPEKEKKREHATLVDLITAEKKDVAVKVAAFGTVQANRKLTLQTEVKGRVIELSSQLDAGGILKEGEVVLKLDPRDYIVVVEQERAKVEKAEFELILEKGRKLIAEKEWQLLDSSLKQGGVGKDLALRIPHLREKEAALQAARSSLERALIDLKRTVIKAPFNALVLDEFVEVGQQLSPQTNVATIVSTDEFRVQVSLPYDQIASLHLSSKKNNEKLPVTIIQEMGDDEEIRRRGYLLRVLGDLDPNGRMVQLLIVIDDPLNLMKNEAGRIPLFIGTYVEVVFEGPLLHDVIELPRTAIREDDTVWVMNSQGELEIREVKILSGDKYDVIVEKGVEDGDKVVVSAISVPLEGMKLKDLSEVVNEDKDGVESE